MPRDPFSCWSHLFGFVAALYVTGLLVRRAGTDRVARAALGCFGFCLCFQYAASTMYHAVREPEPLVDFFRRLDYSAIYLLIAGTHTPIFALLLRDPWRGRLLALAWSLALIGVAAKWLFPLGEFNLAVGLYMGTGAVGLVALPTVARTVGRRGMMLALGGGACYFAGGVCDVLGWPVLGGVLISHEVLHVLDLIGSGLHITFILGYALPYWRGERRGVSLTIEPSPAG